MQKIHVVISPFPDYYDVEPIQADVKKIIWELLFEWVNTITGENEIEMIFRKDVVKYDGYGMTIRLMQKMRRYGYKLENSVVEAEKSTYYFKGIQHEFAE